MKLIVEGLKKNFRRYRRRTDSIKGLAAGFFTPPIFEEFTALRDITFHLDQGQRMAILGPNGSGKTTLLRLLARILRPDEGRITWSSRRIASLISVTTGCHGDLTGVENIFLYGAILGMPSRLIKERLAEIIAFSGITTDFIETPFKYYSQGMQLRLGFAVACHATPDLFLFDEALSAADAEFRERCIARIMETCSKKLLVFATHDPSLAHRLGTEGLVLSNGRVIFRGSIEEALAHSVSARPNP